MIISNPRMHAVRAVCKLFVRDVLMVACWFVHHPRWSHALFRVSSTRYVVCVHASFARCHAVSRVINLSRLESLVLIKLLI
jgi:hypothetical protein